MIQQRQPLFATHRAKRARWWLVGATAGSLVISNLFSGNAAPTSTPEAAPTVIVTDVDRRVAAAPADPFHPYAGADVANSGTEASEMSEEEKSAAENAAISAAAFGTYSYAQDPEVWAAGIPNMTTSGREAVLESARQTWPPLVDLKVVARVASSGIAPKVTAFDAEAGTATVAITMMQTVESIGGAAGVARAVTYQVEMVRGEDTGTESPPWNTNGIEQLPVSEARVLRPLGRR